MNSIKLIIPKKKTNKNTRLKILTWNILASEWIDNETYNMVDKKILYNNKERIQKIITYLLKSDADIISLQEVMPYEYNKIKKAFEEKYNISMLQQITPTKKKNETK